MGKLRALFSFFGKRRRLNNELSAKVWNLRQGIQNLVNESRAYGDHLRDELFIPQYLGMEESVVMNDENTVPEMRVYALSGYNLTRIDNKKWLLLSPEKQKNIFIIENMLEAIIVLKASGVPVSVESVTERTEDYEKFKDLLYGPESTSESSEDVDAPHRIPAGE